MAQRELERFRDDALYVDEHRDELLQRYPESWVAVLHRQVVADDRDPKRLLKKLEKKGIAPGRVYRAHLSNKEELLILAATTR
jgi:hypothetical protein